MNITNSPIQQITFQNKTFFVKRDDLLHDDFSGNKARKFYYFLQNDFPTINKVISHGSNQSNAMYSLSVLTKLKGWKFDYYTNHLPSYLIDNPSGNYQAAIENGMNFIVGDYDEVIIENNISKNELFIREGGAINKAKFGIKILANEIQQWQEENNIANLKIFLPSGTGTTALFLQQFLDIEVITSPCVGDDKYLKKQFFQLIDDENKHPTILKTFKKFHFGKLYQDNYNIWQKLKYETKIEFDLLYDPIGWQTILENLDIFENCTLLYIHQGGLKGNVTMLERYKRKYN